MKMRLILLTVVVLLTVASQTVDAYQCASSSGFWWWVDFILPGENWGVWWHGEGVYGSGCMDGTPVG